MSEPHQHISFFIPAYNCESTIRETVESIMVSNFSEGDELMIVNDASTDNTVDILQQLQQRYPAIHVIHHARNKGGAAARNTAVDHTTHGLLFCLDSDNLLVPDSAHALKDYLLRSEADVAAFQYLHYFKETPETITHKWEFPAGQVTLADYLAGVITPGSSGNYLFTKQSWIRAGGYPEFSGALDAWGFGFRQLATGSKMMVMPDSFYFHRYGHKSYWVRDSKRKNISLTALQILIPFLELFHEKDVDYIMGRSGREQWFDNLQEHPIRVKTSEPGKTGTVIGKPEKRLKSRDKNVLQKIITKNSSLYSSIRKWSAKIGP